MKYTLDTNIFIDGFRSEEAQADVFAFLNRALPFVYLSAVVMQELAAGARTTEAARDVQGVADSADHLSAFAGGGGGSAMIRRIEFVRRFGAVSVHGNGDADRIWCGVLELSGCRSPILKQRT